MRNKNLTVLKKFLKDELKIKTKNIKSFPGDEISKFEIKINYKNEKYFIVIDREHLGAGITTHYKISCFQRPGLIAILDPNYYENNPETFENAEVVFSHYDNGWIQEIFDHLNDN